jgi:hypothetical protein
MDYRPILAAKLRQLVALDERMAATLSSDIPPRVQLMRARQILKEILAFRDEVQALSNQIRSIIDDDA